MLRSLLLKKTKINLYSAWLLFLSSFLLSTQEYVLTGICGAEVKALGQEHCEVKRALDAAVSSPSRGVGIAVLLCCWQRLVLGAAPAPRSGSSRLQPQPSLPPFSHLENCES